VFGNRAIANVALQSQFGQARFRGAFSGSAWPWWRGGLVLGWFGPLFWPYAYYDLFDYVYWPYAYDDFWPYAYDDLYYGIYGPYTYGGPYAYRSYADPNGYYTGRSARHGASSGRYAARANGSERPATSGIGDSPRSQLTSRDFCRQFLEAAAIWWSSKQNPPAAQRHPGASRAIDP